MTNNTEQMVSDALRGSWVHKFLPQSLWPYAQLARWERPIGWQLLMWPCWWSVMLALNYFYDLYLKKVESFSLSTSKNQFHLEKLPSGDVLEYGLGPLLIVLTAAILNIILFFAGAFVMRGAGCTFNDIVDQDIDNKVVRTRSRPLPSGRVSKRNAWIFLGLQLLVGLIILLQFNAVTQVLGFASIVLIIIYPFMKRITWWPQLFLGLAFSWGALMGWSAIIFSKTIFDFLLSLPSILLYVGCICWVIGYDTIYAHQDIEDDAIVGVKSTARLFSDKTKPALIILYAIATILFGVSFYLTRVGWQAWVGLSLVALHFAWQIKTFEYENPEKCLMLFKSNNILGGILFLSLLIALFF